jgi:diphthamide biosynthesis methyltransferase
MNIKTNKMTDQELELLCAEEEVYVQAWRSSLTEEQLNQLNEYIA